MISSLFLLSGVALAEKPSTVFLVRHAEKQTGELAPDDPPLTDEGKARAQRLAALLAKTELAGVYSTDTIRTKSTGEPTATAHELTVKLYDHAKPEALAASIKDAGGSWLVVGHSNTVPGLVGALGAEVPAEIDDAEYDRLYVVTTVPGGPSTAVRLSY